MSIRESLRQIAEQLLTLAEHSEGEAEPPRGPRRRAGADPLSFADPDQLARLAKAIYTVRERRRRYFNPELFADPAWDILLDLFIQKSTGRQVSVSSACIAAQVPATTALRWIAVLVEQELVWREEDAVDRRRAFLRLSERGEKLVRLYLIDTYQLLRPVAAPSRTSPESLLITEDGR